MLFPKMLFLFCYLVISLLAGRWLVNQLKLNALPVFSKLVLGFILLEGLSYTSFVAIYSFADAPPFWSFFLPTVVITLLWLYQNIKTKTFFSFELKHILHSPIITFFSLFLLLFLGYFLETYSQWTAVLTGSGVIYQDVPFHAGITNAILEQGFPVVDFQYAGRELAYHTFTHFVCAKFSYLSSIPSYVLYVIFFTNISLAAFAAVLLDTINLILPQHRLSLLQKVLIGFLSFYSYLFLGGYLGITSFSFFMSYSYQFQIIILLLMINLILFQHQSPQLINRNINYVTLGVLFLLSIVTKGSALPVWLSGFGMLLLFDWKKQKQFPFSFFFFLSTITVLGLLTYLFFFTSVDSPDFLTAFSYNSYLIKELFSYHILDRLLPVQAFQSLIFVPLLLLSFISFRYILYRFFQERIVWFSMGISISGIFFLLFFIDNPIFFIEPALFLTGLLALTYFFKTYKSWSKVHIGIFISCLLLSTYPIASKGFHTSKWLHKKEKEYFPLSPDKLELYHALKENTSSKSLIFTPSIYSTTEGKPQNFYPATLSHRNFYLGGYYISHRFMGKGFQERQNLVEKFSLENPSDVGVLKNNHIQYVLIDYQSSKENIKTETKKILNQKKPLFYQVIFKNKAGVILQLKK